MNPGRCYERSPSTLWQRTSKRALINVGSGTDTFELVGVAALIWDALAEPVSVEELSDDLAVVFGQPIDVVRKEVAGVVSSLVAARAARAIE